MQGQYFNMQQLNSIIMMTIQNIRVRLVTTNLLRAGGT